MPDLTADGTPRPAPNLNSDTERTRRQLYDLVVQMQFSPVEGAGPCFFRDYPYRARNFSGRPTLYKRVATPLTNETGYRHTEEDAIDNLRPSWL